VNLENGREFNSVTNKKFMDEFYKQTAARQFPTYDASILISLGANNPKDPLSSTSSKLILSREIAKTWNKINAEFRKFVERSDSEHYTFTRDNMVRVS
jgi:hypothetical protein